MVFPSSLAKSALAALALSILAAIPASAQTPCGLKTHMLLQNTMADTPGELRLGDGWSVPGPLVTHGTNNVSNTWGAWSNSDFTATADYGQLKLSGSGAGHAAPLSGVFLWFTNWIGAEPTAQYRQRLHVQSATLPAGTPVELQVQVTVLGWVTIVDANPAAWVTATAMLTRMPSYLQTTTTVDAVPGLTSSTFQTAVGDSIDVNGSLAVDLRAYALMSLGPRDGSIAADITAQFDITTTNPEVMLVHCSDQVVAAPPAVALANPRLDAARPNPFNPATTLPLYMSSAAPAELRLYDLRGRTVRVLHRGWLEEGTHELVWDGRDDEGKTMPSGIYFARASVAAGVSNVQRLALVR